MIEERVATDGLVKGRPLRAHSKIVFDRTSSGSLAAASENLDRPHSLDTSIASNEVVEELQQW